MDSNNSELMTVAGGCFWCLEAVFEQLRGVQQVVSGYSGGHVPHPSYHQVCGGDTGHAEVVQVTFESRIISFRELLEVFFAVHDPTTLNRQGSDAGTQYRSAIFYHSPGQKTIAGQIIDELQRTGIWGQPIVTEVTPFASFYLAEEYHQRYYQRNPDQSYCQVIIAPKVAKFRERYLSKLKAESTSART